MNNVPLRTEYPKSTPVVRSLFCLMALLMMFWDLMLLITVLYFHMMIEKGKFILSIEL